MSGKGKRGPKPLLAHGGAFTRWQKLQADEALISRVMDEYTKTGMPADLRDLCQEWFESQNWQELNQSGPAKSSKGAQLLQDMEEEVNRRKRKLDSRYPKIKMSQLCKNLKKQYEVMPEQFISDVASCINLEKSLLGEVDANERSGVNEAYAIMHQKWQEKCDSVKTKMEEVLRSKQFIKNRIDELRLNQQAFLDNFRQLRTAPPEDPQTEVLKVRLHQALKHLEEQNRDIITHFGTVVNHNLKNATQGLYKLVEQWRVQQKEEMVSGIPPPSLDTVQNLFCQGGQSMMELQRLFQEHDEILRNQGSVSGEGGQVANYAGILNSLQHLMSLVGNQFESLIKNSFLFEQLPRTESKSTPAGNIRFSNAKFACTVRSMLGQEVYGSLSRPRVVLHLVKEDAIAKEALYRPEGNAERFYQGKVDRGTKEMNYQMTGPSSNATRAYLSGLQLKSFQRPQNESKDVWEQRYGLLATCTVTIAQKIVVAHVLAYPVVVTVQSSQDGDALATLFWYSSFCEPAYMMVPTRWPDHVPWGKLSERLSSFCAKFTGRGLSRRDLDFLALKFMSRHNTDDPVKEDDMVSWNDFNKERVMVSGRNQRFTAWKWFLGIIYLIRDFLRDDWKKGNVVGFLSKRETVELLKTNPSGTILLRFSETALNLKQASAMCGTVSISYYLRPENSITAYVDHSLVPHERFLRDHSLSTYVHCVRLRTRHEEQEDGAVEPRHVIGVNEDGDLITRTINEAFPKTNRIEEDDDYREGVNMIFLNASKDVNSMGNPLSPASVYEPDESNGGLLEAYQMLSPQSVQSATSQSVASPQMAMATDPSYDYPQMVHSMQTLGVKPEKEEDEESVELVQDMTDKGHMPPDLLNIRVADLFTGDDMMPSGMTAANFRQLTGMGDAFHPGGQPQLLNLDTGATSQVAGAAAYTGPTLQQLNGSMGEGPRSVPPLSTEPFPIANMDFQVTGEHEREFVESVLTSLGDDMPQDT